MRVAGRERVLERRPRRQLRVRRAGRAATGSRSGPRGDDRSKAPPRLSVLHRVRRHGPPGLSSTEPRPMHCGAWPSLLLAARLACGRAAADRHCAPGSTGPCTSHTSIPRGRRRSRSTFAPAPSSTRATRRSRSLPASNEKVPVAYAALSLLGPRLPLPHRGRRQRHARRRRLARRPLAARLRRPDARAVGPRGCSPPRWPPGASAASTGAVIGDESWFDARRVAPGWRPSFYIRESPPLSALVVDRGLVPGTDVPQSRARGGVALPAGSSRRQASGSPVARRRGVLTTVGLPLARDLSEPLAEIVRFMGRESDNYTAEVLVKQLGALDAGVARRPRASGSSAASSRRQACRSPASGSPTARASRASTG